MASLEIPYYFPQFIWKFWLSDIGPTRPNSLDNHRVHIYDVFHNELSETRRIPQQSRGIFQDLRTGILDDQYNEVLRIAETTFAQLEADAEYVLTQLVHDVHKMSSMDSPDIREKPRISLNRGHLQTIRKYLAFLHYRNSSKYQEIFGLPQRPVDEIANAFPDIYKRHVLRVFEAFLRPSFHDHPPDFHHSAISRYWGKLYNSEICLGIATDGQEFILTDSCYGALDDNIGSNPECGHLFFPITPTLALYMLADPDDRPASTSLSRHYDLSSVYKDAFNTTTVSIECSFESPSDVYLRNSILLHSSPAVLVFSSLSSAVQSIASYDKSQSQGHADYGRLKQRCRQKSTQEDVTKTLIVKGSITVTDLTDEICRLGDSAVAHGSFSDVWKGIWHGPVEDKPRTVAIKFLRQVMVKNVREKLLKRLKDEVLAWHRLQHSNIAELFGVVQQMNTIGMVSPWCENGTITHYLEKGNPSADRRNLLVQVASGVSYLHNFKPVVIHGDLKGGNILIDDKGTAIITDFGLSKVMEELSDSMKLGTSFFAGSTRWMAPELVLALVEDDGRAPPITTSSDVYAFASVCLEVTTGQVPYPHRTNDHSVTVDVIRGIKPCRGSVCHLRVPLEDRESFWDLLDRCWQSEPSVRPSMSMVFTCLASMNGCE